MVIPSPKNSLDMLVCCRTRPDADVNAAQSRLAIQSRSLIEKTIVIDQTLRESRRVMRISVYDFIAKNGNGCGIEAAVDRTGITIRSRYRHSIEHHSIKHHST